MFAMVGDKSAAETQLQSVQQHANVFSLQGPTPRTDDYWTALKTKAAEQCVALVWGGNEHNGFYFFEDQHFDLFSRYVKKVIATANIVPQRVVKEKYREHSINELEELLKALAAASGTQVSVVGTPPPKKDNDKLREMLKHEPLFRRVAESKNIDINSLTIRPPHVRLKLWFLLQDMLADAVQQVGGKFIPVAAEVQDEDGFLRPEYWHHDVTHANQVYGEIMLRRVVAELEAR
jgi:hypothetical protein